jgi:hypothetical protein
MQHPGCAFASIRSPRHLLGPNGPVRRVTAPTIFERASAATPAIVAIADLVGGGAA